ADRGPGRRLLSLLPGGRHSRGEPPVRRIAGRAARPAQRPALPHPAFRRRSSHLAIAGAPAAALCARLRPARRPRGLPRHPRVPRGQQGARRGVRPRLEPLRERWRAALLPGPARASDPGGAARRRPLPRHRPDTYPLAVETAVEVAVTTQIEQRLQALGLALAAPLAIPPELKISFAWTRVRGNRVYVAGHSARLPDGSPAEPFGKVPTEASLDAARHAARLTALSILGSLRRRLGGVDHVSAWLTV